MSTNVRSRVFTFCLLLVSLVFFAGCSTDRAEVTQPIAVAQPSVGVPQPSAQASISSRPEGSFNLAAYVPTPTGASFCGEAVPLNEQQVYERFDKEFTIVVYNNAQVYLWLKRMKSQIPWLENRLRQLGLPDDLKYLVIEETDLLPRTWLAKNNNGRYLDSGIEQAAFQQGVDSILFKLKDLRTRFPSWSLTLAAYYCGESRLRELMGVQGLADPYSLQLPPVAETNLFRVLAVKTVMSDPGRYGYRIG